MKIVHLADLHLGYRAYNKITSKGLNIRERDVIRAFKESLDRTAAINPDLILLAGDIFHRPRPGNTSIYLTIKFLLDFRAVCNAPIVMISGNHEMSKSLENENILRVIEATVPGIKLIDRQIEQFGIEKLGVNVLGVPYNALQDFDKTQFVPDTNYRHNILMIHGSYEGIKCLEHGSESLINSDNINQSRWDYVALGHYHKYTKLAENTYYAGAIERTSSNVWQEAKDPKGFIEHNLVTGEHKFHALDAPRKTVDMEKIDVNGLTPDEINQKIDEALHKIGDFEDIIVRLTLENIDNVAIRNLDYPKLRAYRKKALHFQLNFVKKDSLHENKDAILGEGKGLYEYFEEDLKDFDLSVGLNKENFDKLAKSYLQKI